ASCAWRPPPTRRRSKRPRSRVLKYRSTPMARRRAGSSSFREGWSMWSFSARLLTSFPRKRLCRHSRASGNPASSATETLVPRCRGDDESAFRSAIARLAVGLVFSGALVACGFHLRGEAHYSFDTLFLNSPPAQPLTTDLRRSLEGIGSAQLVASPETAQVILDIASVENNKQILSLSGGGK